MEDKKIRKEALRKLLTINEKYCKKQSRKIDSLESQLEFMIKERNMYKDKHEDFISLKIQLKKITGAHDKLTIAYARKLGVLKDVKKRD